MSASQKLSTPNNKTRGPEPRKREGKFAALTRKKDDREQRRNAFMNKARGAREDLRFEARAEQVGPHTRALTRSTNGCQNQRLEWLQEKRQWEAQKAAEDAPQTVVDPDMDAPAANPDSMVDDSEGILPPSDDDELYQYYLLSQEPAYDTELPDLSQPHQSVEPSSQPVDFWSDDDDFDQTLLEEAMRLERGPDWQDSAPMAEGEDTDMSMG